ncbi:hypothetical protein CEP52_004482 [Fusarium oligoseptatum]|uniref:Homoserine dehydrogenase n=1 Tax=Fusarium oligoseptatum TaxID=2604345 RepID=A0A428U391_9HYPO|nr:hypothetical protein CEP52_004482 [Fusarium oligoseptatum]
MTLSPPEVSIAVISAGGVGSVAKNKSSYHLGLVYVAIIDKALDHADYAPIDISSAVPTLEAKARPLPTIPQTIEYLTGAPGKVIIINNTSSQAVAEAYPLFLSKSFSIVTPNKKAFSGSWKLWQDIFSGEGAAGSTVYHECSVEEVKKAKQLGYTELDPRDDLNGLDVARKITIFARVASLPIKSATSFPVQNLSPKELENVKSGDEFLRRLPEFHSQMSQHKEAAEKAGKVARFIGSVDLETKQLKVDLEAFDKSHPIASLKGSDSIISFYTKRYGDLPLIIQGAGAGGSFYGYGCVGSSPQGDRKDSIELMVDKKTQFNL